jgi:glutamine synthetase
MTGPQLTFVGTMDLAGKLRGKTVPAADLERRARSGVGWVPTNALITCFDSIGSGPYGSVGDLVIIPDLDALSIVPGVDGAPDFRLVLGDIRDLDGGPWACCTRSMLQTALKRFHAVSGLKLWVSFEQEFQLVGMNRPAGDAFTFEGFRAGAAVGNELLGAMRHLGMEPEQFIREFGPDQFEVTMRPTEPVKAADRSALFRALARDVALRHGHRATFTPIGAPGNVGNGVHIHVSLRNDDGTPATYDADAPHGLSAAIGPMIGGLLKHLHEYLALLAPSVISYARLQPHRWSAAYNSLGNRDREAAVRICPVRSDDPSIAEKFNIEIRATDAAASPHLALAAVVHAMAEGAEQKLALPGVVDGDPSEWNADELQRRGLRRLPGSLVNALQHFEASATMRQWFSAEFMTVYAAHKKSEMAFLADLGEPEIYRLYRETY